MKARLWWCALLPALIACGDILVVPPAPAATTPPAVEVDSGSGVSTLGEQLPTDCPSLEPEHSSILVYMDGGAIASNNGTSCSGTGGACEYGQSADQACNRVYTCEDEVWTPQRSSVEGCYDAICPGSTTAIAELDGKPCDLVTTEDPSAEAVCDVADGTCECTTGGGAVHARTWACTTAPRNCPLHRPRIGTECEAENLFCDYGSCSSKRGAAVECQGGQWRETTTTCD